MTLLICALSGQQFTVCPKWQNLASGYYKWEGLSGRVHMGISANVCGLDQRDQQYGYLDRYRAIRGYRVPELDCLKQTIPTLLLITVNKYKKSGVSCSFQTLKHNGKKRWKNLVFTRDGYVFMLSFHAKINK